MADFPRKKDGTYDFKRGGIYEINGRDFIYSKYINGVWYFRSVKNNASYYLDRMGALTKNNYGEYITKKIEKLKNSK